MAENVNGSKSIEIQNEDQNLYKSKWNYGGVEEICRRVIPCDKETKATCIEVEKERM